MSLFRTEFGKAGIGVLDRGIYDLKWVQEFTD